MLAGLREQYKDRVKIAQAMLKEQQAVRKTLKLAMRAGPRSVPQLAEDTGIPADEVLWNIAAMKKYGDVEEVGMDDDYEYYEYSLEKEAKQ